MFPKNGEEKKLFKAKWKSSVNVTIFLCLSQLEDVAMHHSCPHRAWNLAQDREKGEVIVFIVCEGR